MSELVGVASDLSRAHAAPLARVSPSLREQQRTRAGSAKIERRPLPAAAAAANSAASAPDNVLHPAIIGGILLPLGTSIKPRSQSATSKAKITVPRAHSPSTSVSRPKHAPPATLQRRGIYTLARAGPSVMTAWEASAIAVSAFKPYPRVTRCAADLL